MSTELSVISYFPYSVVADIVYVCLAFYTIICLLNPISDWVNIVNDNMNKTREEIALLKEEIAFLKSKLQEKDEIKETPILSQKKVTFELLEEIEVKKVCKTCDGTEFSKPTNLFCVKCNAKKKGLSKN